MRNAGQAVLREPTTVSDMRETDYYAVLVNWLRGMGWSAKSQVPMIDRVIDVAAVTDVEEVWAIEVKMTDWRRGLRQAQLYLLGADKAFLAVPVRIVDRIAESLAESCSDGIGLLSLNPGEEPAVVVPAQISSLTVSRLRERIRSAIKTE